MIYITICFFGKGKMKLLLTCIPNMHLIFGLNAIQLIHISAQAGYETHINAKWKGLNVCQVG